MNDYPVNPSDEKKKTPTARVTVHKDHASKMTPGSDVEMHLKGKVKGVNQSYDHPDHYDVEMDEAEVSPKDDEKDESMAKMPLGKLKKKIMPQDEE